MNKSEQMIYDRFMNVEDIEYIKKILEEHKLEVLSEFRFMLEKQS